MKKIIAKRMKKTAGTFDTSLSVKYKAFDIESEKEVKGEYVFPEEEIDFDNYEDYEVVSVGNDSFSTKKIADIYDIEEIYDYAVKLDELDNSELNIIEAAIDNGDDLFEAIDNVDDYTFIEASSFSDLGYTYVGWLGSVEELGQDVLERYFDYDAFGRDLAIDFYETTDGYVDLN